MSTEDVPDEVLEQILDYTLTTPTATFECWREPYTYATTPVYAAPIGDILAVSKRWYNFGIPVLYESAILRSREQTLRFADALHNSRLEPLKLGHFVRRLRVQGGYSDIQNILKNTPGITDLFLDLTIVDGDKLVGLQHAFKKVNPARLFLDQIPWNHHQNARFEHALCGGVAAAMPGWTHLTRIEVNHTVIIWPALVAALSRAPALEYLSLYPSTAMFNFHAHENDLLEQASWNPSLKMIHIPQADRRIDIPALKARSDRVPEKLYIGTGKSMVSILDYPVNVIKETPGPLPDLPEKIWKHILEYATYDCAYLRSVLSQEERNRGGYLSVANKTRTSILLVSKRFYRLGLPGMYAIPHFVTEINAEFVIGPMNRFVSRIESSRTAADLVRVLYTFGVDLAKPISVPVPLKNLTRVYPNFLVLPTLATQLPEDASSAMEWMEQELADAAPLPPRGFLKFPHLHTLILHKGRVDGGGVEGLEEALPALETLRLADADVSLIDVFGHMKLPSLQKLIVEGANIPAPTLAHLLRAHGAKLHSLSVVSWTEVPELLDLCPNLVELALLDIVPPCDGIPFVQTCAPHACLKHIIFSRQYLFIHSESAAADAWYDFIRFLAARKAQLPALEEVRVGTLCWPSVEYRACESMGFYVACLLHDVGLALADDEGRRWRRLTPVPENVRLRRQGIAQDGTGQA